MPKYRIYTLITVLILIFGAGVSSQVRVFGASLHVQEPPLRTSEPVGDIVADLEEFIPTRMEQEGIPGVAVALIQERGVYIPRMAIITIDRMLSVIRDFQKQLLDTLQD